MSPSGDGESRPRVLVKEKIAESGIDLLRQHFDVDVGFDIDADELLERIGDYDGIVIRSGTKLTRDLIDRASRLKVIGRAGIGVDNVDVEAATKRGIVVANAPESNMIAAAEHTVGLILSQCRNIPQAHSSLKSGKWERSRFGGVEVYEKVLGICGFGRIGQLVAARASAFGMTVMAFDPFVGAERFRELGVERAERLDDLLAEADIITLHMPGTAETDGFMDDAAFSKMKAGVRVFNVARGGLVDLDALGRALDSGRVGGAGLDVFPSEPLTEHPIFSHENVVVTPHLGASTVEAQDRAGIVTAEQVTAALTGDLVTNAVNIPLVRGEDLAMVNPFLPLAASLGKLALSLAPAGAVSRLEVEVRGQLAEYDTRLLTVNALRGAFAGRVDETVNLVNAQTIAEERGIGVTELKDPTVGDFTNVVAVRTVANGRSVGVAGTTFGPRHIPHLVSVYGRSFNIELGSNMAFFRYRDVPGMIGHVGSILGQRGINIAATAVDRERGGAGGGLAVMCVTTDQPIPANVVDEIVALGGFHEGRAVTM